MYGNDSGISLKRTNGTCQFLSNSNFKNIPLGSYIVTAENFTQKINVTENDYTLVFFTSNTSQLVISLKFCFIYLKLQIVFFRSSTYPRR